MLSSIPNDRLTQKTMESNFLAIHFLRDSFYLRRSRWYFDLFSSNKLVTPKWMQGTPYQFIYEEAPELLKRGTLVWAYAVQSNRALFAAGPDDHPAFVVFGMDDESNDLDVLKAYSEEVSSLMNDNALTSLPTFIGSLTSADTPVFNKNLPTSITDSHKVCFTTTIIHSNYLPDARLHASWFPLLINPSQTDASIVLPSRYWLPAIKDAWKFYNEWAPE